MKHVIGNNRGVTLAELMVAAGISIVLTSVATFTFSMAMDIFVRTARLMEAETEMLSAMYGVKSAFAQAVNVVYGGNTATTMASAGTPNTTPNSYNARDEAAVVGPPATPQNATLGKLFSTNFNATTTTASPNTHLIALMLREMNTGYSVSGGTLTDNPNSRFFGSAIYFQRPSFTNSGAIYMDQENNPGTGSPTAGGWVVLSPVNATNMFTRLTEFHVENINVLNADTSITSVDANSSGATITAATGRTVLAADIKLVARYFTKGNPTDWRWCPGAQMPQPDGSGSPTAGCNNASIRAHYIDVEKKMKVVFSNNSYDRAKYLAERPLGNIYFFKSWAPTSGKGL